MWNTKVRAVFLVFLMMGILSLTYSLPTSTVVISSTGKISPNYTVNATSGSPTDIQNAINSIISHGGGTVYIPAGTYHWNGQTVNLIGGVNVIGAGLAGNNGASSNWTQNTASTILHDDAPNPSNTMFEVDGSNGKPIRISSIQFEANVTSDDTNGGSVCIDIYNAIDFRVDHCTFINFSDVAINVGNYINGVDRGIIDHCTISNPYKYVYTDSIWGYGIELVGQAYSWDNNITDFLGKYETAPSGFPIVYIEDNHFSLCRHCVASNQGSWYVTRYNLIDNEYPEDYGSIDIHGAAGATAPGGRGLEAYNNTIVGTSGYNYAQAFWIRGGGGVIFNNTMRNIWYGVGLYYDGVPQGQVKDLYIWGNTMDKGTLINNYANYTENVDYFLYAKSGYTPYPYPHPLTLVIP